MATETLRPNAAGDETNLPDEYPDGEAHYTLVDEETADDDATYVRTLNEDTWYRDLYNLPSHSEGSGTINFIKVYARVYAAYTVVQSSLKIAIKTGGGAYESSEITVTQSYVTYSNQWDTNPNTVSAWTWDEIDALQIGVNLRRSGNYAHNRCTQVYVEVDYTPGTGKSSSDAGTGSEGTPAPTATLADSESGQGQGAISSQLVAIISVELGTSVELGALLKELFTSELGQGTDSLAAKIEAPTKGGGMKLWI